MAEQFPFYVYELLDPRDGSVFYVGKGKGDRAGAHEREAAKGVSSAKCDRIRAIWEAGAKVGKREVARFMDAKSALSYESERIGQYVELTNVVGKSGPRKSRNVFLSPECMRIIGWWLKVTDCGRTEPYIDDKTRPFASAIKRSLIRGGGRRLLNKALAAAPREEVVKRLSALSVGAPA